MRRAVAALLVCCVFLAGVAVGAFGMVLIWRQRPLPPRGLEHGEMFAERMRHRLELTPAQTREIGAIMRETFAQSHALRERLGPQVHALMEQSTERIEAVLTPAQRIEFEKLRQEHRARAELFLLGRGPFPPWLREHHGPRPAPPEPP